MIKLNQIHILILDFVNYFINIAKENLAELRRTIPPLDNFLNSLKKPKLKATRSKWYGIHVLPNI
jgi:hypothetical protein